MWKLKHSLTSKFESYTCLLRKIIQILLLLVFQIIFITFTLKNSAIILNKSILHFHPHKSSYGPNYPAYSTPEMPAPSSHKSEKQLYQTHSSDLPRRNEINFQRTPICSSLPLPPSLLSVRFILFVCTIHHPETNKKSKFAAFQDENSVARNRQIYVRAK